MSRNLLTALFAILSFNSYAQIKYDSGYFVNNEGRKTVCLIKNFDWQFNPTEFLYKETETGTVRKGTLDDVIEFGIINFSRYQRFNVDIDTSSQQTGDMDANSKPELKKETAFLKVLAQGKATLYVYQKQNLTKFFFKTDSTSLTPLIHKIYYNSEEQNTFTENNLFRNQLLAVLQSPLLGENKFAHLSYNDRSLTGLFDLYNKSWHSGTEGLAVKQKKDQFNLNLRVGMDLSALTMESNYSGTTKTPFGNKVGATVGLEAEFMLPFNKNKWAIVAQPSYHYYKSDPAAAGSGSADYKMIRSAVGARDYFYLDKDSKLFLTALVLLDAPIGSGAIIYQGTSLGYRTLPAFALSAGYKYKKKCSIALDYSLNGNILDYYTYFKGNYHSLSLVFTYSVL